MYILTLCVFAVPMFCMSERNKPFLPTKPNTENSEATVEIEMRKRARTQ